MGLPSHCCPQYLRGLKSFIEIARADMEARPKTTIQCPCLDCRNDKKYYDFEVLYTHLIIRGFVPNYTCWNKHGEEGPNERGEWIADHQEGRNHMEDGHQMGNKAMVMTVKLMMASMRSAFWSAMTTNLMSWSTVLKT